MLVIKYINVRVKTNFFKKNNHTHKEKRKEKKDYNLHFLLNIIGTYIVKHVDFLFT